MSEESADRLQKTEMSTDGQDWHMADTQIRLTILQRIPRPNGMVTDTIWVGTITGKTFTEVGAKGLKKTLLDLLQQACGEEFEETEHLDLRPSKP